MYYNQVNELGETIRTKVRLRPSTSSIPVGHQWVPYVESLVEIKSNLITQVKQHRDNLISQGGYKVGTKWFHSDMYSRSQQLGLVLLGNNMPSNVMWKTMDKSFIEMTPILAQQIFTSAVTQDMLIFSYAEALAASINNSNDPNSIDITTGWPETYK